MSAVPVFRVEQPGLLTSIQDLGRFGCQRAGMPTAGAMDSFAASVANLLVGNPRRAAVLEITLIGPRLRVLRDVRIALCGADLSAAVDQQPVALWKTAALHAGQTVTFGRRISGTRAYLAVAGGFSSPIILGSRSVYPRGGIGRLLQSGDTLDSLEMALLSGERGLRPADVPSYDSPAILRVLPGPHKALFDETAWQTLLSGEYVVSPQSDRMGYRLSGPSLLRNAGQEMLSEAMPLGGLQTPPDGQPILLMADRQTVGGYPLIGIVASADMSRAAQLAPADKIQFEEISLQNAQALAMAQERWLRLLEADTAP